MANLPKIFAHEGDSKYNIYASLLYEDIDFKKIILYKYINNLAQDIQTGETFMISLKYPGLHVLGGSEVIKLDGIIEAMIDSGKLDKDFNYLKEGQKIYNEFINSPYYSELKRNALYIIDDESPYVDSDNSKKDQKANN